MSIEASHDGLKPVIVMTGVSRGIGRELFKILKEDHEIFAFGREIPNFEGKLFIQDLSRTLCFENLSSLDSALHRRKVIGFIHCAGTLGLTRGPDSQLIQNYDSAMRVNFLTAMSIIDICLPHILSHKSETTPYIANLSSGAALFPIQGLDAYCSSKAATLMAFKCLARRYSNVELSIFSIAPGLVDTDMLAEIMQLEMTIFPQKAWFESKISNGFQRSPESAAQQLMRAMETPQLRKKLHGKLLDFIDPVNPIIR